ncbi:Uncharacterized protein GBIM_21138, partial [Gryllus bimaculatus]
MSVLHPAALHDSRARSLVLLIDAGARVNARDGHGQTPLHYAAAHNQQEGVRALLSAGADKNLTPWSGDWEDMKPYDVANADV